MRTPARQKRNAGRRRKAPRAGDRQQRSGFDARRVLAALALAALGVVMSYSATATMALDSDLPPLFLRHVSALGMGLAAALVAALLPAGLWQRAALPLWAGALGLLLLTRLIGIEVNGARRWLEIPGVGLRFQPVEIAKFATLLAVASVLGRRDGHRKLSGRRALGAVLLALPPVGLLLAQPDLGDAVILASLVALLLLVAGTPIRRIILPSLLGLVAFSFYAASKAYVWRRLTAFLDPWRTAHAEGFQLVQSYIAFARGGLFGVGLGNGQQKLAYLPEAHTDFILSVVAEELGLLGVLLVLGVFGLLLYAGTQLARRARDQFDLLLAFGMTSMLALPAVVNSAVVMGMLPTKGLTLPFLSYGRTSLVTCCAAVGVLLGVSRRASAAPHSPDRAGRGRRRLERWTPARVLRPVWPGLMARR